MKNLFKRVTSFITALAMTMTLTGGVQLVSFAEEEAAVHNSSASISIAGTGEADNDLALEYYLNQKIMGDSGIAMFDYRSNAADILYQAELDMYNYLVDGLTDIADGKANSSVFEYSLYWNYEDLGLASNCTQAEFDAAFDTAEKSINFDGIYYCLLSDLPYELYWHDKTQEGSLSVIANGSGDGSILTVTFTLSFLVAEGYGSGTTVTNLPDLDTVAANINSIIAKYEDQSDLEILTGYKDEICALTEYNTFASKDENNVAYGDPWQLIYVFDGKPETTVVCEGYSKAFKQLCDSTYFSNDVYCFLVTGDTGGPHMWNIVQIGDKFYHVDVTNSDGNAVGSGGGLFLDGVNYTNNEKTAFNTAVDLIYTFDSETLAMYPTECTSLSGERYDDVTITSVALSKAKTEYNHGESFDMNELELSVTYSDGSTWPETCNPGSSDYFSVEPEILTVGTTSVTITYKDFEVTCNVTVNPAEGELEYFGDTEMGYGEYAKLGCIVEVNGIEINGGTSEYQLRDSEGDVVWEGTGKVVWGGVTTTTGMHYYQLAEDFPPAEKLAIGSYEVWFKYSGFEHCAAMTEFEKIADFTVVKGTPQVVIKGVKSPDTVTVNTDISDIELDYESEVEGVLTLDDNQTLTEGTGEYTWTFVPNDTTNYTNATDSVEIEVASNVITITEEMLANQTSGIGWTYDDFIGLLTLDSGFEFIVEGECNYNVINEGTIKSGTFNATVENNNTISGGTFIGDVYNGGTITGGTFNYDVANDNDATISGGTFSDDVNSYGTISGGTFSNNVNNKDGGTITGGTFNDTVDNYGTITGGEFAEVYNYGTIEITNGSVTIDKCTVDTGTVTVDTVKHEHNGNNVTYSELDDNLHTNAAACENCPINYVEYGDTLESHSATVFTADDNVITAKCACGKEFGTFTLEEPADLTYNGTAKEATVTGTVDGVETPTVEYYIGNEKLNAAPTNRGTYTAKITVDDATAELEFTIGAKNISVATVTVTPHEYTGAAQSVGIVLKDGDYTLVKDTDYSITGTSSATDAGTYNVTITGKNNYQGSLEKTWTIAKAMPFIGNITMTPNPIYDSNTIEDITLTYENSAAIPGTLTVNNGQTLTAGQMILKWTFTPSDTLNYKTHVGGMNIIVNADTINSIAVKANPSKTNYIATENFDPTGLVLTVTYLSGKTADVAYTDENKGDFTFDKTTLAKENTAVTVTYSGKTTTVPVTVTNVVTITQDELVGGINTTYGIGWSYSVGSGRLDLDSGFEFKIEGTVSERVFNEGTILSGTFSGIVYNYGTIAGGTFKEVDNYDDLSKISLTTDSNGEYSAVISKTTGYGGTVTVDGNKHEHNGNNVTYSEYDVNNHTKVTACEDCPINLETETTEEHYPAVSTASGNAITLECACGEDLGTITIEAPLSLKYTGTAKEATVAAATHHYVDPPAEYYKGNEKLDAAPKDVGTYTAKVTYEGATAELEFTIEKVVPVVTVTATSNGTLFTSSTTADVTLTATATNPVSNTEVAGTIAFDGAIEFEVGTNDYPVIFTPDDTNYDPVETTVSLTVAEDTLEGITVAGTPAKTEYAEGDKFDPTGLTVTATYASGATKEIEHELLTIFPETLAKGDTSVTVSYNGKTAEVDGITVRGKLKASDFAFTQPESCVYDKTAKAATVEPFDTVTGIGAITVNYYNGSTKLDGAPTNAGTYTVTIDVAEGTEYAAAEGLTADGWTFTIDKADPVIAPSLRFPSTVYDTTDVNSLSLNSGNSDGGKIVFDGDITLEVGTKNYPVIFYPTDSNNYNTVNGTVEITVVKDVITKIEVTTQPTKTEYTYGEEFKADGLVITATYLSGNTETVKYADKPSEFSFTPDELTVATTEVTVTYAEKNNTIEVTVNKAKPSYTAPTNLKANYGDTLADVVLPSGWSWDAPSTSVGEVGTKTFPATYSVADENYEDVEINLGVVVSPKTISIGGIVVKNKDYDGTTDATVAAVTFDGVITPDTVDYTATGTFADKNAGTGKSVTVKVTVTSKNYTLDSDTFTATATINKADPAVTIPQTASAITGLPLSKATLPDGWTWDNPTTVPEDGQSYGITYTPEDTANYNTLTTQVAVTVSDCTHPETKVDIKEATCTEDGLKTTICTICEETTGTEVIPAEHKWNSTYTVDTEATCTTEGEKSIHCKNCPEIKPDSAVTIPAGHKWNEKYSSDDTNHWIECSGCDETKDNGAHQYSYTVGSKQYCSVCRNSYSSADDEENAVKSPGAGSTHPIHTAPKPTQPQIKDENGKTGWDVISDELALAQDGDTVVVDMNGTTKLPKSVLEDIEGRNIDLVLDMGSGITWTINGETVTDPKAVDLRVSKNVKRIPVSVIDNVTGDNFNMEISLAHNGEFGFEAMLTISLGRKYNDCYANLYYYNPSDKAMEFIDCDLIANGNAQLIFAHASDYAIVIDEEALGDDVSSAAGATAENETMGNETVSVVFALPLVLAAGFVIRKKLCR